MGTRNPPSDDRYDGTYDAETVKLLGRAFEEAWASIECNFTGETRIEAARAELADIVLSFPHREVKDVEQIKASSIQLLRLTYPTVTVRALPPSLPAEPSARNMRPRADND